MAPFVVNRLDGAYDELRAYDRSLSDEEVRALFNRGGAAVPDASASLAVPSSRFGRDFARPRVHPIPPANWTNEPHGFIRLGEAWHLFYQRTPNGPYKSQMHWGHMVSRDLVTWTNLPDALWPTLQTSDFGFDMKGDWSGDVIAVDGKAFHEVAVAMLCGR